MDLKNKVIAFDLDGTLARNNGKPSEYTCNTIAQLIKEGYHICIVTGRQWISSHKVYEQCQMNSACVLCNGALVYDPTIDKKIRDITVSKDVIFSFSDNEELRDLIADLMFENGMTTYSLKGYKWTDNEMVVGDFHKTLKQEPNSLNIMAKSFENQQRIKEIITQNPDYNYRYWYLQGEVYSVHFSKKEGIEVLLDYYHKTKDDLVFFGDGENDIEALQFAKYSVAMKNASDEIKKASKYVTDLDNENDGAIKYLLKLIEK